MREKRFVKALIFLILDVLAINFAYASCFYFKYGFFEGLNKYVDSLFIVGLFSLCYIVPLYFCNMYKSVWRITGIYEGIKALFCSMIGLALNIVLLKFENNITLEMTFIGAILTFILTIGIRLSFRIIRRLLNYSYIVNSKRSNRVMIIGAGTYGDIVINEMIRDKDSDMVPICLIDDNKSKQGKILNGVKVLGTREDIKDLVKEKNINTIVLAIAKIEVEEKKRILEICQETKAKLKIVPGISEILEDKVTVSKMRDVNLKDLLGREEIELDKTGIEKYIREKNVLVTGGGGSIGSEICRQVIKHKPKKLIILDIYENNAYDIQNEIKRNFPELNLRVIIASVRDKQRLKEIFQQENIHVVFHAAAHKHVPLMEDNPEEAIKNNVLGTLNVAECAKEYSVEKFVLISTDKAVNPTNIMGATKRLCEMIIQGINKKSKTEFVAVRFGNVLGSNGSVIPLFKKQISCGGPVTLTHKEITRYFMLIPEAAQLVLQAGAYAEGGEIFVLDMGKPVKIYDLAKKLIRLCGYEPETDIKIEITGLRPGEKLYEELLMNEEGLKATKNKKIFIGELAEIDFENLKKDIYEIKEISLKKDKNELKKRMKKVVKTYIEPGEEGKIEVAITD